MEDIKLRTQLKKQKYNIHSLDFIVDTIINDGDLPNNTIGISIDDADKSFFEVGWPLFKKNNILVTIFVITVTIVINNKIYINQSGTGIQLNITQDGDDNLVIGPDLTAAGQLTGDNIELTITQTNNNNIIGIDIDGNSNA